MFYKEISRLFLLLMCWAGAPTAFAQPLEYPKAQRVLQTDNYHGVQITDPYHWMEAVDKPEVQQWMKQQDALLQQYLDDENRLESIRQTMERFGATGTRYSVPQKRGGHYFYSTFENGRRFGVLHKIKAKGRASEVIYDPNEALDGTGLNFSGYSISPSGRYMAYFLREGQGRWGTVHLLDLQTKKALGEAIEGVASVPNNWAADEKGFFYIHYGDMESLKKEGNIDARIRFHQLGQEQDKDKTVFAQKSKPSTIYRISSSKDKKQLVISVLAGRSDQNQVYLVDVNNWDNRLPLVKEDSYAFNFIGNKGHDYFFYTDEEAPNGRVIRININKPKARFWEEVIPEDKAVLAGGSTAGGNAMNLIGNRLVLLYRYGTQPSLRTFSLQGKEQHRISLETGWIGSGIVGEAEGNEAFFTLNTFLDPSTVYRVELETGKVAPFFDRNLPVQHGDYITQNVFYQSKDGTEIPLFIAHKKGITLDGSNPVFMYGYGFGGWVAVPWYQPQLLTWLEMGGIYILPGVRGGGEFGEAWREAGIRHNRQNAIDDYIAAAEYMVAEGYTSPGKIVANGWSASGSLAAAAIIQRPGLFGAGLIGIPSLDLLRYQYYTPFRGWTSGYGSSEVEEDFRVLYRWSPYHKLRATTCYPPILITAGEEDPTTPPQHAYKFTALMQHLQQQCDQPALLKIVWGGGHGFGIDAEDRRRTQSQELAFLVKALGLEGVGRGQ